MAFVDKKDWERFASGSDCESYKKLGAHPMQKHGRKGISFVVWAPEAEMVCVIGEFNRWSTKDHPMNRCEDTGFWEIFIADAKMGQLYKYYICTKDGQELFKADPFGFSMERRPGTASKLASIERFGWKDQEWMEKRKTRDYRREPMYIYELHVGSWVKHLGYREGNPEGFYNYRELARKLADYVVEMGYTHVELIGVAEHQNDYSWGYQVSAPYSINSRHGSPKDFMYFVNYLHQRGIGVIFDWVPAHFSKDEQGLARFDGSILYEDADEERANHPIWGTKVYDYGKGEVRSYLLSNAMYWIEEFHMDGLRVDAVDSMIHLDFGRNIEEFYGKHINEDSVSFLKLLTKTVDELQNGAFTIAEESSAFPKVTHKREEGGLGFTFKWNKGWEHDTLEYIKKSPDERKHAHQEMNFSMVYAYDEAFIQTISHDDFGFMDTSMLHKFPGDNEQKAAQLRTYYLYMLGHPGKKLLFMGQDFGQKEGWNVDRELEWKVLEDPFHKSLQSYMKKLVILYKEHRSFYDADYERSGFSWINADDGQRGILSFMRNSLDGHEELLIVCNFQLTSYDEYRVGVPAGTGYELLLSTEEPAYGGKKKIEQKEYDAEPVWADGKEASLLLPLLPYEGCLLRRIR